MIRSITIPFLRKKKRAPPPNSESSLNMAYNDKSLKKKSKKSPKHVAENGSYIDTSGSLSESFNRMSMASPTGSRRSLTSESTLQSPSLSRKSKKKRNEDIEMGIKNVEVLDEQTTIHTVEVLKRPGQSLGFYIREGNGKTTKKGVFISRIAEGSIVQANGLLKVGDEIQQINSVNVTRTNLDDVVVLMSIPKRLILTIKSRTGMKRDTPPRVPPRRLNREDKYTVEFNPEDSNDSGLSSEHSLKGEKPEALGRVKEYIQSQPKHTPMPKIPEPVYSRPIRQRTDLYASDGEHEYNPELRNEKYYGSRAKSSVTATHYQHLNGDAYNSDSELITKYQNGEQPRPPAPPSHLSSEMKQWVRKFDNMSEELKGLRSPSLSRESKMITASDELDGYRTELWRQEKLLNNAIHNMESALTVDSMLQSSHNLQTNSLPRKPIPSPLSEPYATLQRPAGYSQPPAWPGYQPRSAVYPPLDTLQGYAQNSGVASAYSYLRDLPLLIRTPMKIRIDEFTLYRPEHSGSEGGAGTGLSPGGLKVKIYCGHGLKSTRTALRDLYCVLQLDNVKKAKSMIRTGAINFDWDETFDIEIEQEAMNLVCMIYHWDPNIRHRLCFTGTIRLGHLFNKVSRVPQNVKCGLKLEPRGILYLELSYCASSRGDESISTLFGRPLRETLEAENTGDNIPLLVRKCITEINDRGLNTVGLYRLCGAAKKKNQLRQEFERHPFMVDLSQTNAGDVHVITGLLKDYLRELPHSLLTLEAYQIAEKAMTKEVAYDADQDSLEVVNAFVANLHPWQQGTVIFLLNHLKQVALASAENKMTVANIAVCFGPIFSLPECPEEGKDAHSMRLHIEVIKYLLEIWPSEFSTNNNIVI